jgi:hypothetical protein
MSFIYKPSLWGFTAAAIFIALTIIEVQDKSWVDALMWGLLGVSFLIKYMPKFIVFGPPAFLFSFVTLVAGGAMFLVDAAEKIGNG